MDGDATNSAEGLEDFLDFGLGESFGEMVRDRFRDDRIPAFLIELDALLKPWEEEIPSGKILVDFFGDAVLFFEVSGATVIGGELKIGGLDLAEGGEGVDVVIESSDFVLGDIVKSDKLMVHFGS